MWISFLFIVGAETSPIPLDKDNLVIMTVTSIINNRVQLSGQHGLVYYTIVLKVSQEKAPGQTSILQLQPFL